MLTETPKHAVFMTISMAELDSILCGKCYAGGLSGQELRIAQFILNGYSAPQIASILGITLNTVKSYRKNLYSKLQIHSRHELHTLSIAG